MKAIRLHAAGGPENIVFEEAPMPVLQPGDALVRVLATGITPDELIWGPTYTDENGKDRTPTIPGHELCGIVEATGNPVYALTSFFRNGAAAEYIAIKAADLAPKPQSINAIEAASIPLSGLTAWQALFDHADLKNGQRILIHGGAGGVGIFAVQLAHWCGAYVITTAKPRNVDLVRSLGADEVIDYTTEKFETRANDLDVVFDPVGGDTQQRSWPLLKRGGILVSIAGESIEQPSPASGVRGVFFIVKASSEQLIKIGNLIDQGHIRTIINTVFPLDQAQKAFELSSRSGKHGKIVLNVSAG
jgi:NADPH:quinone reductase-like Zn-dependent oxidoreductase